MSIEILGIFNSKKPRKKVSEDMVGQQDNCAWIFDGASSIHAGERVVNSDHPTDAAWCSDAYDRAVRENLSRGFDSKKPQTFFQGCIEKVREEFIRRARVPNPLALSRDYLPSATMVFLHTHPDTDEVALYPLGDCRGFVQLPGKGVKCTEVTLPSFFTEAEKYRAGLKNLPDGPTKIRENRIALAEGMNNPGHPCAYHILSIHPETAAHISAQVVEKIPNGADARVVLISDGLYAAVETGLCNDPVSFLEAVSAENGFIRLAEQIRIQHPSEDDDMSGVLVQATGHGSISPQTGYTRPHADPDHPQAAHS